MPSYHFAAQVLRRSQGRSAIKAAAYRAGERLRDESRGEVYDYSRRRGVVHTEILLPEGAAPWLADRSKLWNYVERMEKRKDAQLAREINIALPHDLGAGERRELLLNFVREAFVSRGMVADVAFHDPVPEKGDHRHNFHAHVMLTMRQATPDGLRAVKTREWNSDKLLTEWRAMWAERQNRALERAGVRERVDHRTLEAQREDARRRGDRAQAIALDRTPEIHVGPKANKAVQYARPPRSRDREAGPYRRRGSDEAAKRRVVRYSKLDQGSRWQRNADIVEGNVKRIVRELTRLQRRAAYFQAKRQWLTRAEFESRVEVERAVREQQRRKLWQKRLDQEAVIRAMTTAAHRRKRKTVLESAISDVERAISGLLGVRERQLRRHKSLARGPSVLLLVPGFGRPMRRGRHRARSPSGLSSGEPDNA